MPETPPAIHVADLRKTFRVPVREPGLLAAARSLVSRETRMSLPSTGSGSISRPARSSASSARTAPARRRRSRCSAGSSTPRRARPRVLGHVPSRREADAAAPDHDGHGQPQPAPVGPAGARFVRPDPGDLPPRAGRVQADPRRVHRAARARRAGPQAGPQPLARRADEDGDSSAPCSIGRRSSSSTSRRSVST